MKDILDSMLSNAVHAGASDIHIEPREEFVRVRFRIDGILLDQEPLPKSMQAPLISAIKVMVNLDIAESRIPQDGRYSLRRHKKSYDLRISTMPTVHGEKVVVRILERNKVHMDLSALGLKDEDIMLYRKMILKRNGIILVTGPTGSGKTTTLYATLKELNSREYNITTIEDPVEYQLPGITQIQVNYKIGLTFSGILRAVLRQDPDIILVGEIRDAETARISVQAALTGHLIFSTLHTRSAQSTPTRLIELGVPEYLVRDTLIGVVGQRLIRVKPSGRRAIFEIMHGFEPQNGMRELKGEACELLKQGITTKEEILRVLEID